MPHDEASTKPAATTMRASLADGRGAGPYRLYDGIGYDLPDGPTRQPGVMPGRHHEPLRTPFGDFGVPGDGKERNVTDLDLHRNRHLTRNERGDGWRTLAPRGSIAG